MITYFIKSYWRACYWRAYGGVRIKLCGSIGDPHPNSPDFQGELAALSRALTAARVPHEQVVLSLHSQGVSDFLSPELFIAVSQVGLPALAAILVAWVQVRMGRRVRLKVGDVDVEARTPEEIERLLLLARDHQKANGGRGEGEL